MESKNISTGNLEADKFLKKGYEELAEINLEYSDFCLEADSRQLQLYEDKLAECE